MRKLLLIVLFFASTISVKAQEGLKWYSDINQAIEVSRQEQKPLFLFFTGSDWCGWCVRLQNEVFKTPDFIITHITTPLVVYCTVTLVLYLVVHFAFPL